MRKLSKKLLAVLERRPRLSIGLCVAAILCVQYVQLQYSADWHIAHLFEHLPVMYLVNLALLLAALLTLKLLLQRWDLTLLVSVILTTVWSVIDHFTVIYHGSPLYISEFRNTRTALSVMGGYSYAPDLVTLLLLLATAVELALVAVVHALLRRRPWRFSRRAFGICLGADAALIGCLFALLFGPAPVKPRNTSSWSWSEVLPRYGYVSQIVEDLDMMLDPLSSVTEPDGYDPDAIGTALADSYDYAPTGDRPDIILILNETFCDLGLYSDMTPDHDYLAEFFGIDGAAYGTAIVPNLGGGTNNSEFELLLSGSMYLMTTDAPFNYLDLSTETTVSAVGHLKSLGYATGAFHRAAKGNSPATTPIPRWASTPSSWGRISTPAPVTVSAGASIRPNMRVSALIMTRWMTAPVSCIILPIRTTAATSRTTPPTTPCISRTTTASLRMISRNI